MSSKTDEGGTPAKALPAQLADIQLATRRPHFGVAGVADVGVVRPDHDLRLGPARREDSFQRVEHVPVAQVPGFVRAVVHDPIVSLGVRDQSGILGCIKEGLAVVFGVFGRPAYQIDKNADDRRLADGIALVERCAAIGRRFGAPGRQASVTLARLDCRAGIDLVEIIQHGGHGRPHVVEIQTIEGRATGHRAGSVVFAHPAEERLDVGVAPHPGGKAAERRVRHHLVGLQPHMPVDGRRIGPVGFDRHGVEAVLFNETPGDRRAGAIEVAGPVARLAQENHARVSIAVEGLREGGIVEVRERLGRGGETTRRGQGQRARMRRRGRLSGWSRKIGGEPVSGQVHHLFEGSRFFEEMTRARHQLQCLVAVQLRQRPPVEFDHRLVRAADDQQGRGRDLAQRCAREIGPSAARNDGANPLAQSGRRAKRRRRARAGTEEAQGKRRQLGLRADPARRMQKPAGEQVDIEDLPAIPGFVVAQQVEEKSGEATAVQVVRDGAIARTKAAGAAAMGEQDKASGPCGDLQIAGQIQRRQANLAPDDRRRGNARRTIPGLTEQRHGLLVGQLMKIVVEGADPIERLGRLQADHIVGLGAHRFKGVGRRDRDRQNHPGRALTPQGLQGRPGRGAGGKPVIDNDRRATGRADVPSAGHIEGAPTLDLLKLARAGRVQEGGVRARRPGDLLVDHRLRGFAVDDRRESQFGLPRRADFSNHDQVEGRFQGIGDLEANRHAAARQGIDNRPFEAECAKAGRQSPPGVRPVEKQGSGMRCAHHDLPDRRWRISGARRSVAGAGPFG